MIKTHSHPQGPIDISQVATNTSPGRTRVPPVYRVYSVPLVVLELHRMGLDLELGTKPLPHGSVNHHAYRQEEASRQTRIVSEPQTKFSRVAK